MSYLPIPPRVWSRVQSQCTYILPGSSYDSAYIPLTNQTVSLGQALYEDKLQYKGNILQYKGNSSRLTKTQKYSQLAKGFGPNRRKVYATQTQTYTNPNTSSLQRVNYTNFPFPNQLVGQPNNISGPFQYNVPDPFDCSSNILQDGGNLVCGTYQQPCTGEIIQTSPSEPLCFPSYCSDVPGAPINLCWNPKAQTFFPRQRTTMNNSTDKWPVNYKGLVSAVKPVAPYLMIDLSGNIAILTWKPIYTSCIPISSFNIYENGILIKNVPYTTTSITVQICNGNTIFYVTSLSGVIESDPSNVVDANPPVFSITGDVSGNYTYTGSYYIITFQNSNGYNPITSTYTITFNQNINNLNYVIVGGGGGGGSTDSSTKKNGGGGGAGGCITYNSINVTCGNSYMINVGYGGPSSTNDQSGIVGGTSSFASFTANGGAGGQYAINTSGGAGGIAGINGCSGGAGGKYSSTPTGDGVDATLNFKIPPDLSNLFYFSGGGSGGAFYQESGDIFGGFGGGGAGGFSTGYNHGFPYYGPNGIFYPAGNTSINGLISTGGGGAGQNGNNTSSGNVGTGGSGIVVLYFKYP